MIKKAHRLRWALLNFKFQISLPDATNTQTEELNVVATVYIGVIVAQQPAPRVATIVLRRRPKERPVAQTVEITIVDAVAARKGRET